MLHHTWTIRVHSLYGEGTGKRRLAGLLGHSFHAEHYGMAGRCLPSWDLWQYNESLEATQRFAEKFLPFCQQVSIYKAEARFPFCVLDKRGEWKFPGRGAEVDCP